MRYIDENSEYRESQVNGARPGLGCDGYGTKVTTDHNVRLPGEKAWRRVYLVLTSNIGTHFIIMKGEAVFIRSGWIDESRRKTRSRSR